MMRPLTAASALIFSLEAREYENFTLDAATANTIGSFVIALCLGIVVAALYSYYIHRVPGAVVRALLHAEAFSPEKAKTVAELGLLDKPLILWELTRGNSLVKYIRFVGDTPDENGICIQSPNTRYYLLEEMKYRAGVRFDKKGDGTLGLILTCAISVVLAAMIIALLPWFLGVIDKMM